MNYLRVQVDDDDCNDYYEGPIRSEFESDDSNGIHRFFYIVFQLFMMLSAVRCLMILIISFFPYDFRESIIVHVAHMFKIRTIHWVGSIVDTCWTISYIAWKS